MSVSVNSYYTVSTVAELKALAGRPSVVQVLAGNGVYNWTEGNTTTGDDVTVIEPTAPTPAGRYILSVTDYPLTVETLTALKALTSRPDSVLVKTGQAAGTWQWVSGSSTTADDALVVQCTAGAAGRYKRVYNGAVNVMWFGATGAGVVFDTTAIQDALDIGEDILFPPGTYKCAALTVTVAKTRLICASGVTLSFPVVGVSANAITVTANDFAILGHPKIAGPASGVYVVDENGVSAVGTSTAARLSGLNIDAEIYNFGSAGLLAKWVNNINITSTTYVHDCGYIGIGALSCDHGTIPAGVLIKDITPGTASNAYCITLTHAVSIPPIFCRNWSISAQVENNFWAGIDAHGCYNTSVIDAKVFNCRYGVALTTSSGAYAPYTGYNNSVIGCVIDSRKADGTAGSYANLDSAIIVNGPAAPFDSTNLNPRITVANNLIYGHGNANSQTAAIAAEYCQSVSITGNIIEKWNGVAINIGGSNVVVGLNQILDMASSTDTYGICINSNYLGTFDQKIIGNKHTLNGGFAAKEGLRFASTTSRPLLTGNDFSAADSDVALAGTNYVLGSDLLPAKTINLGGGGGSTTIDVSEFGSFTKDFLLILSATAPITITNLINGMPASTARLVILSGSSAITFDRSNSALAGSANWVGNEYDVLCLHCYALSGSVRWVEVSRSANG